MPEENDSPLDASIDYTDATYTYDIPGGSVTAIIEFIPSEDGIVPSGRMLIVYLHPERGTVTFYIEMNEHCNWISYKKPPFITDDMVEEIGEKIDKRDC